MDHEMIQRACDTLYNRCDAQISAMIIERTDTGVVAFFPSCRTIIIVDRRFKFELLTADGGETRILLSRVRRLPFETLLSKLASAHAVSG